MTSPANKYLALFGAYIVINIAVIILIKSDYNYTEAIFRLLSSLPLLLIVLLYNSFSSDKVKLVLVIFVIIGIGQALVAFKEVNANVVTSGLLFVAIKVVVFEMLRSSGGSIAITSHKYLPLFVLPLILVFGYGHFMMGPVLSDGLYLISMLYSFVDAMLLSLVIYYTFIKKTVSLNGFICIGLILMSDFFTGFQYSNIEYTNNAIGVFLLNAYTRFFFLRFVMFDFLRTDLACQEA